MSSATEVFDPYREWLGIEPRELLPDHYRLLGLPRFEADAGKIAAAADGRMRLIRSNQTGPRGSYTHTLLNEITAAKLCLLSPLAKAQYDKFLREFRQAPIPAGSSVTFFPTAVPLTALPPAYSPYQAAGVPVLEPPLAAPPVVPMAVLLAPPKQARKSELAVDVDKPPSQEETPSEGEAPQRGSRLRTWGMMGIAVLLIAGTIWGASQYLFPPPAITGMAPDPDGGETPAETKPESPPDPASKAIVVMQEGSGELNLPPSAAALVGAASLKIAVSENVLGGWTSADDAAIWKFKLLRPGFFKLELSYASAHEGEDVGLEFLLDEEEPHKFELASTRGTDKFVAVSHTVVVKASGAHTCTIRPAAAVPEDSLVIKSLRLIPVGGQP